MVDFNCIINNNEIEKNTVLIMTSSLRFFTRFSSIIMKTS